MPTSLNISASRAGAILGMSNYSTPLQVWLQIMESREPGFCEKNNYQIPEFEYNSAMKWGHAFESAVIELAEEKQNNKIEDREKIFAYNPQTQKRISFNADIKEYEGVPVPIWLIRNGYVDTCHIDGSYWGTFNGVLHEGKTTSAQYFYSAFGEPGTDRVPVEYQLQCQHQMICTGADKVILSVLVFPKRVEEWEEMGWKVKQDKGCKDEVKPYFLEQEDNNPGVWTYPIEWARPLAEMGYFHQYTIHAHSDLQKLMLEAYADFWNNHVLTGIPPEPQDYTDIKSICRSPKGLIVADENMENLAAEYKSITKEISSTGTLAKRKEQIKTQILNKMIDIDKTVGTIIDDNAIDKFILMSRTGKKLFSYDGKVFR